MINEPGNDAARMYVPSATYRLQFQPEFRFSQGADVVDYLAQLGIGAAYSSPIWTARAGSTHGYDVIDHSQINGELGGEPEFKIFTESLKRAGLGLIVDVVPNHMGVSHENRWWYDVLENGPASSFAPYFDIDWDPPKLELRRAVQIAALGKQFGACLESGELQLRLTDDGAFILQYYDKIYPTAPRSWPFILRKVLQPLRQAYPSGSDPRMEFESIITELQNLPSREEQSPERLEERQREKEVAKRRLRTLFHDNPPVRLAMEQVLTELNGVPGQPASFDDLEHFLNGQPYRLSFWRVAPDEINYRRFFDVNDLAAIRVELPEVFRAVHELILRLVREGAIQGLRIDHPDGLFNPAQYFKDLQDSVRRAMARDHSEPPADPTQHPIWMLAEKILSRSERLRSDWAVHGTTGYDFLNLLNGLFVDARGEKSLWRTYTRFIDSGVNFGELMYQSKKLILDVAMSGELVVLSRRLDRISEQHRHTRDFTLASIQQALADFIAAFPVYRSYIRPDSAAVEEDDRRYILAALRSAKRRNPSVDSTIYDFIGSVLLLENQEFFTPEQWTERRDFVLRLQQFTGPVMAKGLEDTAFYREFPLVSLNEVGGEPDRFGTPPEEFHRRCREQLRTWPHTMLATSTHDTKRSEDVRARINVLSEIPGLWEKALRRWRTFNRKQRRQVDGIHVPTAQEEYMLYQTLIGTWPFSGHDQKYIERIKNYMVKAAREAKLNTSWVGINTAHEEALAEFVGEILDESKASRFLADLKQFISFIMPFGALNALSQVLVKTTAPGIPDFYQGTELWGFYLVDPDNRHPVDFALRKKYLDEIHTHGSDAAYGKSLCDHWQDGRVKLFVTHKALAFRRSNQQIFDFGEYIPLDVAGPRAGQVIAFARSHEGRWVLSIAPRLMAGSGLTLNTLLISDYWKDTYLLLPHDAPRRWANVLTSADLDSEHISAGEDRTDQPATAGERISLEFLSEFPVALLSGQTTGSD